MNVVTKERDYSKPVVLTLSGQYGLMQFQKILNSSRNKYNATEASRRAANVLRAQGVSL